MFFNQYIQNYSQQFIDEQPNLSCQKKLSMNNIEIKLLLNRVIQNSQYLTNLEHYQINKKNHRHQQVKTKQLCPISVARLIVQLSYFIYTCSLLKLDIYLSSNPLFIRKYQHISYQIKYIFYLAVEDQDIQIQNVCNRCKFNLFKTNKYNTSLIKIIQKIIKSVQPLLLQKVPQQLFTKQIILKFMDFLKTQVQPKVLDNYNYSIIKQLETHDLFIQHSDMLKAFKSSLYYSIKKNAEIVAYLTNLKKDMNNKILLLTRNSNNFYFYKELDCFILHLVKNSIVKIDKSLPEDLKKGIFMIGAVQRAKQNSKNQIYTAQFYIPQKSQIFKNQQGRQIQQNQINIQKNPYTIQYDFENLKFIIRYVAPLQSNSETIDIISNNCSNIAFGDKNISVETLDIIRNPIKLNSPRKYVFFKSVYMVAPNHQPFTKILQAIQFVTICSKIFMGYIGKINVGDSSNSILEYTNRCRHLHRLFVQKARQFYQKL